MSCKPPYTLWTSGEKKRFVKAFNRTPYDWKEIAKQFPGRSPTQIQSFAYRNIVKFEFPSVRRGRWTFDEIRTLHLGMKRFGHKWHSIAKMIGTRDATQVAMFYHRKYSNTPWTPEEHALYKEGLALHGPNWNKVAEHIDSRTVYEVREHARHFDIYSDVYKRGPWSDEEREQITQAYKEFKYKWDKMAERVPTRTRTQIVNFVYKNFKERVKDKLRPDTVSDEEEEEEE